MKKTEKYWLDEYCKFIQEKIGRKDKVEYVEKHHIMPKSWMPNNMLIELSPFEHYVAHWLLNQAFPKERTGPTKDLSGDINKCVKLARIYERKKRKSEAIQKGKTLREVEYQERRKDREGYDNDVLTKMHDLTDDNVNLLFNKLSTFEKDLTKVKSELAAVKLRAATKKKGIKDTDTEVKKPVSFIKGLIARFTSVSLKKQDAVRLKSSNRCPKGATEEEKVIHDAKRIGMTINELVNYSRISEKYWRGKSQSAKDDGDESSVEYCDKQAEFFLKKSNRFLLVLNRRG